MRMTHQFNKILHPVVRYLMDEPGATPEDKIAPMIGCPCIVAEWWGSHWGHSGDSGSVMIPLEEGLPYLTKDVSWSNPVTRTAIVKEEDDKFASLVFYGHGSDGDVEEEITMFGMTKDEKHIILPTEMETMLDPITLGDRVKWHLKTQHADIFYLAPDWNQATKYASQFLNMPTGGKISWVWKEDGVWNVGVFGPDFDKGDFGDDDKRSEATLTLIEIK